MIHPIKVYANAIFTPLVIVTYSWRIVDAYGFAKEINLARRGAEVVEREAFPSKAFTTSNTLRSSVATITRSSKCFPGSLVEPYRAGIIPTAII